VLKEQVAGGAEGGRRAGHAGRHRCPAPARSTRSCPDCGGARSRGVSPTGGRHRLTDACSASAFEKGRPAGYLRGSRSCRAGCTTRGRSRTRRSHAGR
jgi:hypothetical protein